jgi:hypothetical protein
MYVPDFVAMEAERQRCIARENVRMAKVVVGNVSVLDELPQRQGCGWSADAALDAITALEQLRPLSDALRGPQPAAPAEAVEEPSSGEAYAGFENALGSDGVLEAGSGSVAVAAANVSAGLPPSGPVEPLRTLARKLLPTLQYGPLIGHLFDRQFHEVALGQPPNENMVGRWGTWRRGACVDDSFNPEHRGYGYRLYDSVLHGLPLFVETGTWSDACHHYINLPVLFSRVIQVTACSYHDPLFGFKSADGIWGQVHVADPACGACRDRGGRARVH